MLDHIKVQQCEAQIGKLIRGRSRFELLQPWWGTQFVISRLDPQRPKDSAS